MRFLSSCQYTHGCCAPASWAARHTTVCLDHIVNCMFLLTPTLSALIIKCFNVLSLSVYTMTKDFGHIDTLVLYRVTYTGRVVSASLVCFVVYKRFKTLHFYRACLNPFVLVTYNYTVLQSPLPCLIRSKIHMDPI